MRDVRKNFWKLKKLKPSPKTDVLALSKKTHVAPILIVREILKTKGYNRKEINRFLRNEDEIPSDLKEMLEIASANDPVYSQKGLDYAKQRGEEGEQIINLWLESKGLKFVRDSGSVISLPDLLLEKPITMFNKSIQWVESKCYYGGQREMKEDEKQFKRFDAMGNGVVIYWFGYKKPVKRFIISGEEFKKLLPKDLIERVDKLLNFIPPEFAHLLK